MTEGQGEDEKTLSNNLKKIFLHEFHNERKAKFAAFAGFHMPIFYNDGILKEHLHVRNSVGLFDVSHMGQILIPSSKNNIEFLLKYIPINLENFEINKSYYSFLLNEGGGIIDDLIIKKIKYQDIEHFYIVYNASRKKEDEELFTNNLSNFILLKDNSLLAIQGPKSQEALKFIQNLNDLVFMQSKIFTYLEHEIILCRSGYTGEDGFEISVPNLIIKEFIKDILNDENIKLCGLGSRDSLRLEAGLSLYGNELNENITPVDANLTWSIHKERLIDKKLNGNAILLNQINSGVNFIKIGFKPRSKIMLRNQMKIVDIDKNEVGYISSGGFSPILNSSIGIGYLEKSKLTNNKIYCLIRDKLEELEIEKLPFISNNYKRG